VLRLAKLTDAEYVLRQVAGGLEDYYLGSGEAPGIWSGRLADQLGLAGVVEADELRALIDRRHPASGVTLAAGSGRRPTVRAIVGGNAVCTCNGGVGCAWPGRLVTMGAPG